MIRSNIIFAFLLTNTVLSSNHFVGNGRRISSDGNGNALMELAEEVLIQSGQDIADFRNALTDGNVVNSFAVMSFEDIITEAEKELNEIKDLLSGNTIGNFEDSYEADDVKSSKVAETVVITSVGGGTSGNKTIESTITYANGTTTHNTESFPVHLPHLKKNATIDEIADAYNNVMKKMMPKVLNITVEWDDKIGNALDDMVKNFKKEFNGPSIFSNVFNMSMPDILWDYDLFSSSFIEELDDVDRRITVDDNVWNELNALAEDFLKVIHFH
jgi:hypothetical protein